MIRAKAPIWASMHRGLDDTLSFTIEAAVEPDDDGIVRLEDAMPRSIAHDVFDQATGPLLVSEQGSVFTYEGMLAVRAAGQGRAALPATV